MIRRYGEAVKAGQRYRRRPGVYAVLLDGDAVVLRADGRLDAVALGSGGERGKVAALLVCRWHGHTLRPWRTKLRSSDATGYRRRLQLIIMV